VGDPLKDPSLTLKKNLALRQGVNKFFKTLAKLASCSVFLLAKSENVFNEY
jgi:hypothetical protein